MNLRFLRELAVVLDHLSNYISCQQELYLVELLLSPNYFLVSLFVSSYIFICIYTSLHVLQQTYVPVFRKFNFSVTNFFLR